VAEKTIKWADAPTQDDLDDAGRFLSLLSVLRIPAITDQRQELHPVKDLLRAARLPGLPQNNAGVAKWLKRIKAGDEVPPVLLVRGDLTTDRPLLIAEGYHRVSACYLLDEATPVAGFFLSTQPIS
jgi:hypothetical protein